MKKVAPYWIAYAIIAVFIIAEVLMAIHCVITAQWARAFLCLMVIFGLALAASWFHLKQEMAKTDTRWMPYAEKKAVSDDQFKTGLFSIAFVVCGELMFFLWGK